MAGERYQAEKIDFMYSRFVLGGGFGGDSNYMIPAIAVYVPEQKLLVQTDSNTNVLMGPPQSRNVGYLGEEAETKYASLKDKLAEKGVTPSAIEVDQEFVDWGIALNRVHNPGKSIVDLLQPKF